MTAHHQTAETRADPLEAIEELLAKATPGPWYFEPGDGLIRNRIGSEGHRRGVGDFAFITIHERVHPDVSDQSPAAADAALIVALVNAAPELTRRLRQYETVVEEVTPTLSHWPAEALGTGWNTATEPHSEWCPPCRLAALTPGAPDHE